MNEYYLYKKTFYPTRQDVRQSYFTPGTGYVLPVQEPSIDDFFQSKQKRAKSRIESLVEAIDRRRLIKEQNLYGIEQDLSQCQNLLFDLGYRIYSRDRQWEDLETRKLDLFREKRLEQSASFRDITLLGKELRDTVNYYQTLADKQRMFGMGSTEA
jgi:hypothetical protein